MKISKQVHACKSLTSAVHILVFSTSINYSFCAVSHMIFMDKLFPDLTEYQSGAITGTSICILNGGFHSMNARVSLHICFLK